VPPHDDPWRHWSDGRLDAVGSDSSDEPGEDILTSFLGQLESGINPASSLPGSQPAPEAPAPDAPATRHVVRPQPDPPPSKRSADWGGSLSAVLPSSRGGLTRSEEHLPSVEPEALPDDEPEPDDAAGPAVGDSFYGPEPLEQAESIDDEPAPVEPAREAATDSPDDPAPATEPKRPTLSAGSPKGGPAATDGDGSDAESMPVSFAEWLEKREENGHVSPLEGFGRYDDGIVVHRSGRREINAIRVLLLVMVGAALIGFRWLWVKTIAEAAYPEESELIRRADPAPTTSGNPLRSVDAVSASADVGLTTAELQERERESRLRSRMGGHVLDFNTPEQLEDALFQELMNRGATPRSIEVESLREKGTQDNQRRRPTQAHLKIELAGVSANEDEGYDQLMERLTLTWLLVGKYQTLGRITFEDVTIRVAPPLPFERRYEGRRLAGYWDGQITSTELFLEQ
jgi:hypothetical protein